MLKAVACLTINSANFRHKPLLIAEIRYKDLISGKLVMSIGCQSLTAFPHHSLITNPETFLFQNNNTPNAVSH
jgi:hypothetical protein